MPLLIMIISLLGLLNEVKAEIRPKLFRLPSELIKAGNELESNVNKKIGYMCGTYIALQLPVCLVGAIDPMPPRFAEQFVYRYSVLKVSFQF